MAEDIKKLREEIDRLDDALLSALERRAQLAQKIGALKGGAPVYRPVFRHKRCIAPASWWGRGSQTTWVCKAEEICCYDRILRKGSCLTASQRCF